PYGDRVARELFLRARDEGRAACVQRDVGAPRLQGEREPHGIDAASECGEPAVAPFPAVAVRTMEHGAAVALFEARHEREIVDDARRQQEKERLFLLTVSERHPEPAVGSARAGDTDAAKLHAVRRELTAAE